MVIVSMCVLLLPAQQGRCNAHSDRMSDAVKSYTDEAAKECNCSSQHGLEQHQNRRVQQWKSVSAAARPYMSASPVRFMGAAVRPT